MDSSANEIYANDGFDGEIMSHDQRHHDDIDAKDMNLSLLKKEEGNNLFRQKKFEESISAYSEAIHLCPTDTQEARDNLAIFYGNRAACYYSLKEYDATINDCNESLQLSPNYTKVLFRRSLAFEALERYEESLQGVKLFFVLTEYSITVTFDVCIRFETRKRD